MKQARNKKFWKKEKAHYKEARLAWKDMDIEDKNDYAYRRIGEEEAFAYIKTKKVRLATQSNTIQGKFIPKSPYADFINVKVEEYTKNKSKVKFDHKFFFIMFKIWKTQSEKQKKEYINKYPKFL